MKPTFMAASKWIRSAAAIAAVLSTVLVIGSIEGLAHHYSGTVLASKPHVAVAQR